MDRSSSLKAVTFLLTVALFLGPVAAVCGTCCPEPATRTELIAPAGCCGDCEPKVERSPDPASLTSKNSVAPSDSHAVLLIPAAHPLFVRATSPFAESTTDRASPPRVAPSPLRL